MRRDPQSLTVGGRSLRRARPSALRGASLYLFFAAVAGVLVSCKSMDEPSPPAAVPVAAVLAPAGGSTMSGRVSFWAVDGGLGMGVNIANVRTGQWRVVIHATGNCTSPNAFSAGPPLEVPGVPSPIVVGVLTGDYVMASITLRVKGLALEGPNGIIGRSVVVHSGSSGPLDAVPGVPNNRYACGVIERVRPLSF